MTKYLLVIAVVFIGIWLWRQGRIDKAREQRRPPAPPVASQTRLAPQAMVRCAQCGLHLPLTDALPGAPGRAYCSAAHREAAEG